MAEVQTVLDLDKMTVLELRTLCKQLKITGYSSMKKAEILEAIAGTMTPLVSEEAPKLEEVTRPRAPVLEVKEEPKEKPWEAHFIEELSNVCANLDSLEETSFLPDELNVLVSRIKEATTPEELIGEMDDESLAQTIYTLRRDVPKYNIQVYEAVKQLGKATCITVDVDYI